MTIAFRLKTPNVALLALFVLGLRALETKSEFGLLPRSEQRPTCAYSASTVEIFSKRSNRYTFLINLPGIWWATICSEKRIIDPILDTIESRCLDEWARKGAKSKFADHINAIPEKEHCRIGFKVVREPEEDSDFPNFEHDCVLIPKPEPCGVATRYFPWPSICRRNDRVVWEGLPQIRPNDYTPKENQLLVELKEKRSLPWREIAKFFPGRSLGALQRHYQAVLKDRTKPELRPIDYSAEDDQLLIHLRGEDGLSWNEIAEYFPTRSSNALQKHYYTKLRQSAKLRMQPYTAEEDALLIELKEKQGMTWNQVAQYFPERSEGALRHRYWAHQKKTLPEP